MNDREIYMGSKNFSEIENKLTYEVELYLFNISEKLRRLVEIGKEVTDTRFYKEYQTDIAPINISSVILEFKRKLNNIFNDYEGVRNTSPGQNVYAGIDLNIRIIRDFGLLEKRINERLLEGIRKTYRRFFDLDSYIYKETNKHKSVMSPRATKKTRHGHRVIRGTAPTNVAYKN